MPTHAETGYGYIERGQALSSVGCTVQSFREKPDKHLAEEFLASGNFLWNAGIFVWSTPVILDELRHHLPKSIETLANLAPADGSGYRDIDFAALSKAYASLPKISIDHAVLEVSRNVAVVDADIGWQDVGSWDALEKCFPTDANGNLCFGDGLLLDCTNTTVDSDGDLIACIGLKDMIVVKAKGAILVCPSDRAQDVKKVVAKLQEQNRDDYL